MIQGVIHMKQERSYINIAPRPRGQAIYEANCSPVSHGGRTVYYAWGLVTCFKAAPKTGRMVQWKLGVGCFYYYRILSCVVGGKGLSFNSAGLLCRVQWMWHEKWNTGVTVWPAICAFECDYWFVHYRDALFMRQRWKDFIPVFQIILALLIPDSGKRRNNREKRYVMDGE